MNRKERRAQAAAAGVHPRRLPLAQESETAVLAFHARRVAVARALAKPATMAQIDRAAWELLAFGDGLMAHESTPGPVACARGCSFCCHLEVTASVPEVLHAADRICKTYPEAAFAALRAKLRVTADALVAARARGEKLAVPCAFLGADGACTVYTTRPLVCRGWISRDVSACQRGFESRDPTMKVPNDEGRMAAASSVSFAVYQGATDAGLDGRPVRFVVAMRAALDDPGWAERWAAGERIPEDLVDPVATRAWAMNPYPPLAESAILAAGV